MPAFASPSILIRLWLPSSFAQHTYTVYTRAGRFAVGFPELAYSHLEAPSHGVAQRSQVTAQVHSLNI